MLLNGVGAVATGITLVVVLVAKFAAGAWITLVVLPLLLVVFLRVKRHYAAVEREIASDLPLDVQNLQRPLVVVPIKSWNAVTRKALRFALKLSPDVVAVYVADSDERAATMQNAWPALVAPSATVGLPAPQLHVIPSPYRRLYTPLMAHIAQLERDHPTRQIAVIVPQLVEKHWYHYLLHNQTAAVLKAMLLFGGDRRVVVINVPWYLEQ